MPPVSLPPRVARRPEEQEPPQRLEAERRIVQEVDRLVAATPVEKAQLVWLYGATPSHISVIPPGVDLERFRPLPKEEARRVLGFPPDRRYVLFVGRIEPLKGLETLMRAVAILAQECPTWTRDFAVVIIGGDPDAPADAEMRRLQRLREDLGVSDLVTFLGAKAQETLPYYYNAADVVVMPSDYESFGLVALEAMACGTPVIASEVGGLVYLVRHGETGLRVPRRQPIALARALDRLLRDEGLRRRMGESGRRWAQEFAWPLIADRILGLYQEVLKAHRARSQRLICYRRGPAWAG
jgi:D-inositol-3-phosphate glycosyltransferase